MFKVCKCVYHSLKTVKYFSMRMCDKDNFDALSKLVTCTPIKSFTKWLKIKLF